MPCVIIWHIFLCVSVLASVLQPAFAEGPVQLSKANFETYFTGLDQEVGVLLEFYAHW